MARNPIIVQRELRAQAAAEAAKAKAAAPKVPAALADLLSKKVETPDAPKAPTAAKESFETLPDSELADRAKTVYGKDFDSKWDRDTLIQKLLDKGATA